MADNYLEKRYEEVFGKSSGKKISTLHPSLDTLLLRNRSCRGFDKSHPVHQIQMESIVSVNTRVASGMNAQRLRFHIITKGEEADRVLPLIHLGGALPELNLPLPGQEPEAFVVVCSTCPENPIVDIDLGISLQSMLLKAVDLGLAGVIVRNFDKAELVAALGLQLEPLAVLAIGRPMEKFELDKVHDGDSLKYYRRDGIHHVPKLGLEDIVF